MFWQAFRHNDFIQLLMTRYFICKNTLMLVIMMSNVSTFVFAISCYFCIVFVLICFICYNVVSLV
jgi:hypothetical protein